MHAPVNYAMNPGLPKHVLAASPGGNLMAARLATGVFSYGTEVFGSCYVERLDPTTGQPLWSCGMGDSLTVESGAVDEEGNVYVAGRFISYLALCDGTILGNPQPVLWDVDLYLLKFSPGGLVLWSRNISMMDADASMIPELAIDPQGSLWYSTCDFFTTRIVRVDADGNDVETRVIDGAKTIGGMAFGPSGALYVSGSCDDTGLSFGGITPTPPDNDPYLMFLLRYDAQGQGDWAEYAHDVTFQFPDVAVDEQGNAFVACGAFDGTDWGGVAINGADWVSATFMVKADSAGQFLWGVESDPSGGTITGDMEPAARTTVSVDGDGNAYLTGTIRGLIDWGGGVVSDGLTMGVRTQTIVAFDPGGSPLWATTSQPASSFLNAMAVAATTDGTVHFSTHVSGTLTYPPFTVNAGGQQAYAVGRIDALSTGMALPGDEQEFVVWPVPASSDVMIHSSALLVKPAVIFSSAGQEVMRTTLIPGVNRIDVSKLDAGLYLLRTATGERVRLIKE